jgi:hypothetical protein
VLVRASRPACASDTALRLTRSCQLLEALKCRVIVADCYEIRRPQEIEMVLLCAGGDWNRVHAFRDSKGRVGSEIRPSADIRLCRWASHPFTVHILFVQTLVGDETEKQAYTKSK